MKNSFFAGVVLLTMGAMLTGCGKSPESIVNDAYKAASEHKYESIGAFVLPDSVDNFSEEELKTFADLLSAIMQQNEYSSYAVDSVVVNPEETEATFVVKTNFKNGLSFTETGTLRKKADGTWRLMADKETTDTTDVFSVSDKLKRTPELMRNLRYATIMTLAGRGIPQYQVLAAQILKDGVYETRDDERAFDLLKSAADKNYLPAYKLVANTYYKGGKNIPVDYEKAFEWYTKASEAGDVTVYTNLGQACREGEGTMKDYDKAKEWYDKGIEIGDAKSMRGLAYMYLTDFKGFENDNEKAFNLYNKAYEAATDDLTKAEAANSIGYCYDNGFGVAKDGNKAVEWFIKAAESGDEMAMYNVGQTFYWGLNGIPKDYNKAFYWYSKSDKAEYLPAKIRVAECYEYGRGVDMNKGKAKSIYSELWRKHDDRDAERALERLWSY